MEGGRDAFLGMPMAPAGQPSSSFLGSVATSSGGPQMLTFSSNSVAGLGLSSGSSNMQGVLSEGEGAIHPDAVVGARASGTDLQALCCECPCTVKFAPPYQKKSKSLGHLWLQLL